MLVTVLGCGSSAGVPLIGGADGAGDWGVCDPDEPRNRRSRSSIVIESDNHQRLLVDTSPDLRSQLIACRVRTVDAVAFTHAHADHIAGLDDVRILNRLCGHPLEAFGDEKTLSDLERRFTYAFQPYEGRGFYRPVMIPRPVAPGQTVTMAGMKVQLFDQDHGFAHSLGLRIGGFGYSTDVVALDEPALATLAGVDIWLVDCFQRARHPTHAWLDRVAHWVARLQPRRTVLTHMGPDMDWAWLAANLPAGMEAGFDGMVLEVGQP